MSYELIFALPLNGIYNFELAIKIKDNWNIGIALKDKDLAIKNCEMNLCTI